MAMLLWQLEKYSRLPYCVVRFEHFLLYLKGQQVNFLDTVNSWQMRQQKKLNAQASKQQKTITLHSYISNLGNNHMLTEWRCKSLEMQITGVANHDIMKDVNEWHMSYIFKGHSLCHLSPFQCCFLPLLPVLFMYAPNPILKWPSSLPDSLCLTTTQSMVSEHTHFYSQK